MDLCVQVNNAAYSGAVLSDAFVRAFEAVNDWVYNLYINIYLLLTDFVVLF